MLNAFNTKILLAILAALGTIGALLVHEQQQSAKARVEAAQAAAIADQQRREAERFASAVKAQKQKKNVMPANESKTWRTYVP